MFITSLKITISCMSYQTLFRLPEIVWDADGKTNWRMLCQGAVAGVVAVGRLLHLVLQVGEVAPKHEAGGEEAGTLMAACSFQRRATQCPAAALSAAILPTSPMLAQTVGDSYHLPATCSLRMYRLSIFA